MTEEENERDWDRAKDHVEELIDSYSELVGMSGVNPFFALGQLHGLMNRYRDGERTDELFDAMMKME